VFEVHRSEEANHKKKIGFQTIVSSVLIAGGLLIMPVTAYSTDRGELRRDARDTKQSGRQDARDTKQECRAGDEKSRPECQQDKRDAKQDARTQARDIKY
jgi:hypothetical protein